MVYNPAGGCTPDPLAGFNRQQQDEELRQLRRERAELRHFLDQVISRKHSIAFMVNEAIRLRDSEPS